MGLRIFYSSLITMCLLFQSVAQAEQTNNKEQLWEKAGFEDTNILILSESDLYPVQQARKYTHEFGLTVFITRGSGWELEEVIPRLRKAAEIYSKCQVRIGRVKVVTARLPGNVQRVGGQPSELSLGSPNEVQVITKHLPSTTRPILFYVNGTDEENLNGPAFAVLGGHEKFPWADYTAWISRAVAFKDPIDGFPPNNRTEAHELAHILFKSLHVSDGSMNLLAEDKTKRDETVTTSQCKKLRNHELVKPIR